MHNPFYTYELDDQCQDQIHKSRYHDTAAGVGQLLTHGHVGIDTGI